jgi:hypothetical protein
MPGLRAECNSLTRSAQVVDDPGAEIGENYIEAGALDRRKHFERLLPKPIRTSSSNEPPNFNLRTSFLG